MGRRVLIITLVLVVALFVYVGYRSYDTRRSEANGEVFSGDSSATNGRTGGIDERVPENQTDDKTVVHPQQNAGSPPAGQQAQPRDAQALDPQAPQTQPSVQPTTQPQANGTVEQHAAHDTLSPHPPNGMAFSGSGKYQLYRQGDLTWRLNTDTGQSCILFATDEQWRKPRVFRNGCGSR
jgi:hypothetical protein